MAKTAKEPARVVEMVGPDTRMDEAANPLPIRCSHCTLPNLDFVPRPYLLVRGFTAPAETAPADVGNFLVRERVRRILEAAVPGACTFVPTADKKTKKATEWWLAVPAKVVDMPGLPHRGGGREKCSKCGEPKLGYYPYQPVKGKPGEYRHVGLERCDCAGLDVFKPKQWYAIDTVENQYAQALKYTPKGEEPPPWSRFGGRRGVQDPPPHPQRWTRIHIGRDLFFSVRLEQLLRRAKVKGQLVRASKYKAVESSEGDEAWIEEKLAVLAKAGLIDAKAAPGGAAGLTAGAARGPAGAPRGVGKAARGGSAWLRRFIEKNRLKKPTKAEFASFEKKHKLALPSDYKDFISAVGARSFEDVMGIGGFTARVLPPAKLDARGYRRAKWKQWGVESEVDGVAFARTDHGDVFVFDASSPAWPVFWYDHEQNSLEPFAAGFAQCIERFEKRT